MDFHWFVGGGLSRQLPFKKRHTFFGENICEWGAVMPMAKAGFMIGCALATTNPKSAEVALQYSTEPNAWRDTHTEILENLSGRLEVIGEDSTSFDALFPEWQQSSTPMQTTMNEDDSATAIGQRVILGLITGLLNSTAGTHIVESWVTQNPTKQRLGVRGLSVQERPIFSSIEEAKQQAAVLYDGWEGLVS